MPLGQILNAMLTNTSKHLIFCMQECAKAGWNIKRYKCHVYTLSAFNPSQLDRMFYEVTKAPVSINHSPKVLVPNRDL